MTKLKPKITYKVKRKNKIFLKEAEFGADEGFYFNSQKKVSIKKNYE